MEKKENTQFDEAKNVELKRSSSEEHEKIQKIGEPVDDALSRDAANNIPVYFVDADEEEEYYRLCKGAKVGDKKVEDGKDVQDGMKVKDDMNVQDGMKVED